MITAKLPTFDDLIKQLLIFSKVHPDWSLSTQCLKFNEKFKANLTDDEYYWLLWYSPDNEYINQLKQRIDALHPICPSCQSNEIHYPLFKDIPIVCFICGTEYPLPVNFDDHFPYNIEVEQEKQEYGLENLQKDKHERLKHENEWNEFVKQDIARMNQQYEEYLQGEKNIESIE